MLIGSLNLLRLNETILSGAFLGSDIWRVIVFLVSAGFSISFIS